MTVACVGTEQYLGIVKLSFGRPISRKKLLRIALLIAIVWTLAMLGPLSLGIIPVFVFAGLLAVRWRSAIPLSVVVVSPIAMAFGLGIAKWSDKHPAYVGPGLPAPSAFNLDRDSRLWWNIGGCVVSGNEWVFDAPHNFGLWLTSKLLGPPRGTYHGIYPSEEETQALTDKAALTPSEKFFDGVLIVDGKEIDIGKDQAEVIRWDLGQDWWDGDDVLGKGKVSAVIVNSECLIVRIVSESDYFSGEKHWDGVMLIDFKTMRPFARYAFVGTLPRIPRYALQDRGGYGK